MIYLIYIILFVYIIQIILSKKENYLLIPPLVFSYIFGGMLSDNYLILGRLPQELIVLGVFFLLTFQRLYTYNKTLTITWGDRIFFVFYFSIYILPWAINLPDYLVEQNVLLVRQFILIKMWIIYRIFYYIYLSSNIINKQELMHSMFRLTIKSYIFAMLVAGIIGTLRLLDLPLITLYIDTAWPIVSSSSGNAFRMQSTVGGINGGGLLFALSAILSMYLNVLYKNDVYIYIFTIFIFFLLLTASFSSIVTLAIMLLLFIYYIKEFKVIKIFKIIIIGLIVVGGLLLNTNIRNTISDTLNRRIEGQMNNNNDLFQADDLDITPNSFKFRIELWKRYAEYFVEKPFFGYGYKVTKKANIGYKARTSISESYFVELLLYAGGIGFFIFVAMYYSIYRSTIKGHVFRLERNIIKIILIGLFISQISNRTLMYGGIMELFGISLFFIFALNKTEKHINKKRISL